MSPLAHVFYHDMVLPSCQTFFSATDYSTVPSHLHSVDVLAHNLAVEWAWISSGIPQYLHLHCHSHHIQTSNICHDIFLYPSGH